MTELQVRSQHHCFGGIQGFYQHNSKTIGLPMRFSVYEPPQAQNHPVPVVFFLAGLTCTDETFMTKAGAQQYAAEYGLMLVTMDTSPPKAEIVGETDNWDLGVGAGFYLNATEEPWSAHYHMENYVTQELPEIILSQFPADKDHTGIFGHSMGGHGALTLALRNPDMYQSVSAFAPIATPVDCPWGKKAFSHYLGAERKSWRSHDATALIEDGHRTSPILIDQGLNDPFLTEQLHPDRFELACKNTTQKLTLRYHKEYDHGYYFISTFIMDHLHHHHHLLTSTT